MLSRGFKKARPFLRAHKGFRLVMVGTDVLAFGEPRAAGNVVEELYAVRGTAGVLAPLEWALASNFDWDTRIGCSAESHPAEESVAWMLKRNILTH